SARWTTTLARAGERRPIETCVPVPFVLDRPVFTPVWMRTVRSSDDGGASTVRGSFGWSPTSAGSASAVAIPPVISTAARTRAQVLLMFPPSEADHPYA